MKYHANNFIAVGEPVILSGIVISGPVGFTMTCDFRLTNKKIIMCAEDELRIIPLNQITEVMISSSRPNELRFATSKRDFYIQLTADRAWSDQLVYEISKRIGNP